MHSFVIRSLRSAGLAAVLLVLAILSGGCVVSPGKAQYTAHVQHEVPAGVSDPSSDISVAFGLDGHSPPDHAVASVNDNGQ